MWNWSQFYYSVELQWFPSYLHCNLSVEPDYPSFGVIPPDSRLEQDTILSIYCRVQYQPTVRPMRATWCKQYVGEHIRGGWNRDPRTTRYPVIVHTMSSLNCLRACNPEQVNLTKVNIPFLWVRSNNLLLTVSSLCNSYSPVEHIR